MDNDFVVSSSLEKANQYQELLAQITAVTQYETDTIALMANVSAMLKMQFGWFWIGFYRVQGEELILGPFQGTLACTRIPFGKGVCGSSWAQGQTLVVPDVHQFPGHIACSSASLSEIVVPVRKKQQDIIAVLDIDSDSYNTFDATDALYLEQIVAIVFAR